MAGDKADLPDLPHPGGVHHHHKAFFDRHTYQHDAHPVRISNAQVAPTRRPHPHPHPPNARTLARSHARINREPKSSRFRITTWGCSDSRPGRCSARPTCPRALFARPDSTLAHSRLSRSRACRALALSRSFVRQDHPFLLPHPSRADSVPFPGAPKESPRQDCKAGQRVDRPGTALVLERHERSLEHLVARRRVVLPRKYLLDRQRAVCVRT